LVWIESGGSIQTNIDLSMTLSLGTVLVVDDEPRIHRLLTRSLAASGYSTLHADRGGEALRLAAMRSPNVILLDLRLPDIDGHEVLKKLREFTNAPIIIISGRTRESEKVKALDAGADDYVEKPFQLAELLARIRVALRGGQRSDDTEKPIILGTLTIDPAIQYLTVEGKKLRLTKVEHALLVLLARHRGRVLSHSQLLTAIWGPVHANDLMYLRVYVGRLRRKLRTQDALSIITQSGVGYSLLER
jgi:two-component system KDP operon response regulator KdpE